MQDRGLQRSIVCVVHHSTSSAKCEALNHENYDERPNSANKKTAIRLELVPGTTFRAGCRTGSKQPCRRCRNCSSLSAVEQVAEKSSVRATMANGVLASSPTGRTCRSVVQFVCVNVCANMTRAAIHYGFTYQPLRFKLPASGG